MFNCPKMGALPSNYFHLIHAQHNFKWAWKIVTNFSKDWVFKDWRTSLLSSSSLAILYFLMLSFTNISTYNMKFLINPRILTIFIIVIFVCLWNEKSSHYQIFYAFSRFEDRMTKRNKIFHKKYLHPYRRMALFLCSLEYNSLWKEPFLWGLHWKHWRHSHKTKLQTGQNWRQNIDNNCVESIW